MNVPFMDLYRMYSLILVDLAVLLGLTDFTKKINIYSEAKDGWYSSTEGNFVSDYRAILARNPLVFSP